MRHGPPELYSYTALYSAIHYTAIQRYTLYNLYNTPLVASRRLLTSRLFMQLYSDKGRNPEKILLLLSKPEAQIGQSAARLRRARFFTPRRLRRRIPAFGFGIEIPF